MASYLQHSVGTRSGKSDMVAKASVLFLRSPKASNVPGASLVVDGGFILE